MTTVKRSTLLALAHKSWRAGKKDRRTAEVLAESGLFASDEIHQITQVALPPNEHMMGVKHAYERFNPATLDMLEVLAQMVESGVTVQHSVLAQACVDHGTSPSVVERLTGYATQNSRRIRPAPDGTGV